MLIRKKLAILTLVACIATTGTGCGLFVRDSELQKNIYGVTSVNNVNATENNCYYVAKNDGTFQKLYMGRATFYNGKNSSNSARVAWFGRDYDRIPTMYRGEKIVFRSDAEFDELFVLERFEDLGHTIGVCGLTASGTGRYRFSTDRDDLQIDPDSNAAVLYELGEHMATIEQIGGIQLRSGNISRAGTIVGLEEGRSYKTDVYVGTSVNNYSLIADVRAFVTMETYEIKTYDYEQNRVVSFAFPDGLESGYYLVDGFGFVRYIKSGQEYDPSMDMNLPAGTDVGRDGKARSNRAEEPTGDVKKRASFRLDSDGMKKVVITYSEDSKDPSKQIAPPKARIYGDGAVYTLSVDEEEENTLSGVFDFKAGDYIIEVSGLYLRDYEYRVIAMGEQDGAE